MELVCCSKCEKSQAETEFYKDPRKKNGLTSNCKTCLKAEGRKFRATSEWKAKKKAYDREYHTRPGTKDAHKKWAENNWDKVLLYHAKEREKHPEKREARKQIRLAVLRREIEKKPCEICGKPKVEAHHEDYSKPLDVMWLCHKHHIEHHKKIGTYA